MKYAIFIVFTLVSGVLAAQPMLFTQYFVHRQWDNPAAMGAEMRTAAAFAGQYRLYGFENAPMTGALQVTVPFGASGDVRSVPSGVGAYYSNGAYSHNNMYDTDDDDGAKPMAWGVALKAASVGVLQHYEAMGQYAYRLDFSESSLSFGLGLGVSTKSNNYTALTDEYSTDPMQYSGQREWSFAAQTGVSWQNENFYGSLYSPAIVNGDIFAQGGYGIMFGGGENDGYNDGYDSPSKKNRWEVHIQGGRLGTGKWLMQETTIFTLKGLFGFGAVWQYPNNNLSALAALTIGSIQIGYTYSIYGLNENLLQHEISIKIRFSGKKEVE